MITPRRTRLVRVPDLHDFRRAIAALCADPLATDSNRPDLPSRLVIVPTRGAADAFAQTLARAAAPPSTAPLSLMTRDELYDALHARLPDPPRRLSAFERDAMAQAAAEQAAGASELPFKVRPGLVTELLRFYDQLRRQSQLVTRFEELITDALGGGELDDRGAERLLRQTRFVAQTFRGYEERAAATSAVDEHRLREMLLSASTAVPVAHVIVTVPDWIADPAGLFVADFDLLNRLPNLAAVDIVSTEGILASGFHERLHNWWPGLDEATSADLVGGAPRTRPLLVVPQPDAEAAPLWFTHRDREEELISVARRLAAAPPASLEATAVVFKKPLPYLYLATDTLGTAGVPYTVRDALPLAAEPAVAPVDLILDAVESLFARDSLIALLRSPHLDSAAALDGDSIAALDRHLSDARYLGGADRLYQLAAASVADANKPDRRGARSAHIPALRVAKAMVRELAPLAERQQASHQLSALLAFISARLTPLDAAHPLFDRERRARAAVVALLQNLASAHEAHHDPLWSAADLATAVRRWIGEQTFVPDSEPAGVQLLDDQAARYGTFDDITVVGLIESEWPERTRRNIFYPPTLLKALNWPSEADRRSAADARFLDLLASATSRVELSVFLLDEESIVSRSIQLDEVPRARLSTISRAPHVEPLTREELLALRDGIPGSLDDATRRWLDVRSSRTSAEDVSFHGTTGPRATRTWSVSALETYLTCPFKFYAQHVLRLEEEPDDEEVMDPRRQGQFVHEVFETFFREWQEAGHREITATNIPVAREQFAEVVDRLLARIPEGEAALERTRLLGSPAAAGLGEAVFRMEAERVVPVVARLIEHRLDGPVMIQTANGPRTIQLRGKADRLDLLADGTFRLIDYKLGWPPDRSRALQLPIYALSAEQQLNVLGRRWTLGEAMYLAFKGPKRVVPLFSTDAARTETLGSAQQRIADTLDAIERGEFPPTPEDVFRCDTCSFFAVCRKDYVGDI